MEHIMPYLTVMAATAIICMLFNHKRELYYLFSSKISPEYHEKPLTSSPPLIKKRKIEILPEHSFSGHESIFGKLEKAQTPREETIIIVPSCSEKGISTCDLDEIAEPEIRARNAYEKMDSESTRRSLMSSRLNLSKRQASLYAIDSFKNKRERFYEKLQQVSATPKKETLSTSAPYPTAGGGNKTEGNNAPPNKIVVTAEKPKSESGGVMSQGKDTEKKTENSGSMFTKPESKMFGKSEANNSSSGLFGGNTEKKAEQNVLNLGYKPTNETSDLAKTQRFEAPADTVKNPASVAPKTSLFGATSANAPEKSAASLFGTATTSPTLFTSPVSSSLFGSSSLPPNTSSPSPTSPFGAPASTLPKNENKPADPPGLFGNPASSSSTSSLFGGPNNTVPSGSLFASSKPTPAIPDIKGGNLSMGIAPKADGTKSAETENKSLFSGGSLFSAPSTNMQPFGKTPADTSASPSLFSGSSTGMLNQSPSTTTPALSSALNPENKQMFGGPKANTMMFGETKTNQPLFGDNKATPALFGDKADNKADNKANQPMFGDNKTNSSIFGENKAALPIFGGNTGNTPLFGAFNTSNAGGEKTGFGFPSANPSITPALFGNKAPGSLFGSSEANSSGNTGFSNLVNPAPSGGFGGKLNENMEGVNKTNPSTSLFGSTGSNPFPVAFTPSNPSNQGPFNK